MPQSVNESYSSKAARMSNPTASTHHHHIARRPTDRQAIGRLFFKVYPKLGMVIHACISSTWEAEAQGLPQILGQPELFSKTSPQKRKDYSNIVTDDDYSKNYIKVYKK